MDVMQFLPLVFVFAIMYFLLIRPRIKSHQNDLVNEANICQVKLPRVSERIELDKFHNTYRKTLLKVHGFGSVLLPSGTLFLIGLAVFAWKASQTSDFDLMYNRQAQEDMGSWMIGLGILVVIYLIAAFPYRKAHAEWKEAKLQLTTALRDALAFARDEGATREVIEIEQALEKLERIKSPIFTKLGDTIFG